MGKANKVVLAYSGGLDTSVIIPWLKENYGAEVLCVDLGQPEDYDAVEKKRSIWLSKAHRTSLTLRKSLYKRLCMAYCKSWCTYEGKYLLGTSFARPLIKSL